MTKPKSSRPKPSAALCARAEAALPPQESDIVGMDAKDVNRLVHELRVSQVELRMQNEELRQAQAEQARSRDRFNDLYDFAPVGYLTHDAKGLIIEANLTAARMLGMDRAKLLSTRLHRFVDRDSQDAFRDHCREAFAEDRRVTTILTLRRADGDALAAQLESVADAGAKVRQCRTALIDVSRLKRIEQDSKSLNRTLEHRTDELRALAAQLVGTEQRERRRLARVLHDHVQQLMVGAKFSTGILRAGTRTKTVLNAADRIAATIDEAIKASRSLAAELSPPVLHAAGLVAALGWLGRQMQEEHGLRVDVLAEGQCEPEAEEIRIFIFEAVREMLLNVAKHARTDHARVRVSCTDGGDAAIIVEDDGCGFDPARLEDRAAASGFGLFSIRERVILMGGRLEVQSQPERGSRFTLVVPVVAIEEAMGVAARDSHASVATGNAPPDGVLFAADRKTRVLLADDHTIMREGLAALLKSQPDIAVVGQADDGRSAVDLALKLKPDVVLMDITMPGMDGFDATRVIARDCPSVRVIGLSMHEEAEMGIAMRRAGAAGYLVKGGSPDTLLAAIRSQRS